MTHEPTDTPTDFAETFAEGWRAPADAAEVADHFEPWLDPEFRFNLPVLGVTLTGRRAFREHFAPAIFAVMSEVRGSVERWAAADDSVFIEMRVDGRVGSRPVTITVCDRHTMRDGRLIERVLYADATPLIGPVLRAPLLWPRLAYVAARAARAARGAT